jgi:hypothetical protein
MSGLRIQCPHPGCPGSVVRIERHGATLQWDYDLDAGSWASTVHYLSGRYLVFCDALDGHHDSGIALSAADLTDELRIVVGEQR